MKTISFFTPKGGCGKTTLTILFASYVFYFLRLRVLVVDLEALTFPVMGFRKDDLQEFRREASPLRNYFRRNGLDNDNYQVFDIECLGKEINTYSPSDVLQVAKIIQKRQEEDRYDLILIDCPAGFSHVTPFSCLSQNHLIDKVIVPMSTDTQERRKACSLAKRLSEMKINTCLLWYRLPPALLKTPDRLDFAQSEMEKLSGATFLSTRIPTFAKASQGSDVKCFVRNTLCWPEQYLQMYCPALPLLFAEISEDLGI